MDTQSKATEGINMPPMEAVRKLRSVEEALSEVERESQVRERIYGKWIQDGKISRIDAADRGERMLAACHYLKLLHELPAAQQKNFLASGELPF